MKLNYRYVLHYTLVKKESELTEPFYELELYAHNRLKAFNLCMEYIRIKHGKNVRLHSIIIVDSDTNEEE